MSPHRSLVGALFGALLLLGCPWNAIAQAPALNVQEWVHKGPVSLRSLRGKVVLLEFFQIVCPPCEVARPEIEALQEKYRDQGLRVVGIAAAFQDLENQTPELIRKWAKEHSAGYPLGIDQKLEALPGELPELRGTFDAYEADATPYVIAIDRQGAIRGAAVYPGFDVTEEFLLPLLAESPR